LENSLKALQENSKYAKTLGLKVAMGHGLNSENIQEIANIDEVSEFNIGQSIIARAVFIGLESAIKEISEKIKK